MASLCTQMRWVTAGQGNLNRLSIYKYIYPLLLQVKAMAEGRDRRPELGYKLAMELKSPDSVLSQRNGFRPSY